MNDQFKQWDHIQSSIIDLAFQFGPKLLVAVAIIVLGNFASRWVCRIVDRGIESFHLEPPVRQLLVRLVRVFVLAMFAIMALQNLGVELLPLIAGLGVAGAGIALAMQGVLSNIVAGLTIIFTKPFRVGEYISIVGEEGTVVSISLFSTILSHADQSQVVIPNRKIVGEILHNYGNIRQIDIAVGVAYGTDPELALAAVDGVLRANPRVLCEPVPVVAVASLTNIAIRIAVKPWVTVADFGPAQGELTRDILKAFDEKRIAIPHAKLDEGWLGHAG